MPVITERDASRSRISEKTLGIIIAAVLCSTALGILFIVLYLTARQHRGRKEWESFTQKSSPIVEQPQHKLLRSSSARKLFSSRSSNAPEVLAWTPPNRHNPAGLSITRRPSQLNARCLHDSSEVAMLTNMDENLQTTPEEGSKRSNLSSREQHPSPEDSPKRASLSRRRTRSMDAIDAASRVSNVAHDDSQTLTPSKRPDDSAPPVPQLDSPATSPEHHVAYRDDPVSPLIPSKNPQRRLSPKVHYPSWNELQDFVFDEVEAHQSRPKSIQRRSSDWRPDGDRLSGRYELG